MALSLGGSLNAMTCYLLERSLKTLALRVEHQTRNAGQIARFLREHDLVRRVCYPGLVDSAGHAIANAQMTGFGAMLSFEPDDTRVDVKGFVKALELIKPAVSLGGVESTICVPAETSHSKMSAEERQRVGVTDSLLRLSVGIEHVDDLRADLNAALRKSMG